MKDFVAFRATYELLQERHMEDILEDTLGRCISAFELGTAHTQNFVKAIYEPFTNEEISAKIADIVKPADLKADLAIVYQTVDSLNKACPYNLGDWYFTGNFPTPEVTKSLTKLCKLYERCRN
jgi:amidophosphoribosyltransferase